MAGRPLGLRSLVRALSRYSQAQLKKLIASVPTEDNRVARLKARREKHLEAVKKLDREIARLNGGNGSAAVTPAKRRRRRMSAETRRKMSEAAKRRYAKAGGSSKPPPEAKPKAMRRAFSPEARAKMAAAAKRRWAKVKGGPAATEATS